MGDLPCGRIERGCLCKERTQFQFEKRRIRLSRARLIEHLRCHRPQIDHLSLDVMRPRSPGVRNTNLDEEL